MKLNAIPLFLGFLAWLIIQPKVFPDPEYSSKWSYGPYLTIAAIVIAAAKSIHFTYYNGKKRLAQNYAKYADELSV